jgi:hypothetical protein
MLPCAHCTYESYCLKWAGRHCPDFHPKILNSALVVFTNDPIPPVAAHPTISLRRHRVGGVQLADAS